MNKNSDYEGLNLDRICQEVSWNKEGLIPAVVQDIESGEVLMLAYMNEEALKKTITEGRACYYSRSRKSLWLKGETSGHYQNVIDLRFDCDKDTLLLKVKQTGMACHEDYYSCFHYQINEQATQTKSDKITEQEQIRTESPNNWKTVGQPNVRPQISLGRTLELLAEIIKQRNLDRPEGSYTTYLFTKGVDKILKKVGEECAEVIIAAKNDSPSEIRYEASDLLYHLLVLLEDRKVDLQEIAEELTARGK